MCLSWEHCELVGSFLLSVYCRRGASGTPVKSESATSIDCEGSVHDAPVTASLLLRQATHRRGAAQWRVGGGRFGRGQVRHPNMKTSVSLSRG